MFKAVCCTVLLLLPKYFRGRRRKDSKRSGFILICHSKPNKMQCFGLRADVVKYLIMASLCGHMKKYIAVWKKKNNPKLKPAFKMPCNSGM